MRKQITLIFFLLLSASFIFAGSINDTIKNTQTPYLGEKSGFDSLFVNPAGMAGQTDIFNFSVFGSVTVPPDIADTVDLAQKASEEVDSGTITEETAADLAQLLADNLDQADFDTLTQNTVLYGMTPEQVQSYLESNTLSSTDLNELTTNFNANQDLALSAFDEVAQVYGTGSVKLGTLLGGLGLALYNSEGVTVSLGNKGIKSMATETGVQAGYGLKLGPLALGASANMALWTLHENIDLVTNPDIKTAPMGYAYAYGLDIGAQFTILPGVTLGAVVNNLIGSSPVNSTDYTSTTLQALLDGNLPTLDKGYIFSTDLDVGVTWAPNWPGWFRPMLSADYYDFISLFTSDTELTMDEALSHLRLGASLHLLIFDFGAQYYNEYLTLGAGFDLAFFQIYLEGTARQDMSELGGSVLVKLHF